MAKYRILKREYPDGQITYEVQKKILGLFWWNFENIDAFTTGFYDTLEVLDRIWTELESRGFAANNAIFGVGAFCFSAIFENGKMIVNTRDTFGCACKATYGVFGDKGLFIYKDPKTDTAHLKKSHKGLVFVEKIGKDYVYTNELNAEQYAEMEKTHKNAMRLVFKDGKMHNRETFSTIRARLASEE